MFEPSEKQREALDLIATHRRIMLYGGSRSGKTAIIVRTLIIRAVKERSRHVCFRQHFNHIKTSLWHDTFPDILRRWFPYLRPKFNNTDYYIEFSNGSQIWFAGLDDKDRTDKILGTQYSSLYFNEASQINYSSVTTALTRLSENTAMEKRAFFDCNPPTKHHWTYRLFIECMDPASKVDRPIASPEMYAALQINPMANKANLPAGYIEETLMGLSEMAKRRFLYGEFSEGRTGGEYYASFDYYQHVGKTKYNPDNPIHVSFDFNYVPYNPAGLFQMENKDGIWHVCMIDEFALRSPHNSVEHVCDAILARYGEHKAGWLIYGDATGRAGTIANREQRSYWDTIFHKFRYKITENSKRVPRANKPNNVRRDFTNRILEEKLPIRIKIGDHCRYMSDDLMYCKEDADGMKDKKTVKDETGQSYQPYGHFGDLLEYFLTKCFEKYI